MENYLPGSIEGAGVTPVGSLAAVMQVEASPLNGNFPQAEIFFTGPDSIFTVFGSNNKFQLGSSLYNVTGVQFLTLPLSTQFLYTNIVNPYYSIILTSISTTCS